MPVYARKFPDPRVRRVTGSLFVRDILTIARSNNTPLFVLAQVRPFRRLWSPLLSPLSSHLHRLGRHFETA